MVVKADMQTYGRHVGLRTGTVLRGVDWVVDVYRQTLGTTGTTWDGPLIDVEFGVWWHLYDVIPQRQKRDCFTGKYRSVP